ncbi:MAG: hypothetical protein LAO03_12595 [Acidobacteriia bacterium]|nr:hypothetical protein [Terriglobia bacterium]
MPKKPTVADAELILKLYDLRREPEMRKARNWWLMTFWPQTAEDFMKVANAPGTPENNWLRQVIGYWEMSASLVLHGAANAELFLETSFSGEMYFLYAKMQPILKDLRQKMNSPRMFGNIEKVLTRSKDARERLRAFETRVAARRKAMAGEPKAS